MKSLVTFILFFLICQVSFGQSDSSKQEGLQPGVLNSSKEPTYRIHCLNSLKPVIEPLYVVDECVSDKFRIQSINPNHIQSITILKGEEASKKYGEKAKNGVILILTKKVYTSLPQIPV
jgi:TonB-dependent SusC/RagA subfamily outer membrane receptor